MVAADQASLFEAADTTQAGGGRDAGAAGEFDVGHAPVGLEFGQDPPVDGIEDIAAARRVLRLELHLGASG
jgi:hypothetical protein